MRAKLMFLLVENSMNRDYCFCNGNCFLHWNGSILICVIGTFWRKTAVKLPAAKWLMRITIALRISFICLYWIVILFRTFGICAFMQEVQTHSLIELLLLSRACLTRGQWSEGSSWFLDSYFSYQHNFFLSTDDSVLLSSSSTLQH